MKIHKTHFIYIIISKLGNVIGNICALQFRFELGGKLIIHY